MNYPQDFYDDFNSYLDNEWLCPYCVAPTHPKDKTCPQCNQPLLMTSRVSVERSAWLWRGIFLQTGIILLLLSLWSVSYILTLRYNRIFDALAMLPLYLGLPVAVSAEVTSRALAVYPRWIFWGFAGAALLSLGLMGLLYFRVKHGNTVYFVCASVLLGTGLLLLIFFRASGWLTALGVLAFFLGAAQMLVTMNLWNDFKFKTERLRLVIEGGVKTHASFYLAGRKYAELGMWGLAALHYRRAVGQKERNTVYHLALAVAYGQLGRFDLAEKSLDIAEKLDPDSPEIWQLRKKINAAKLNRPPAKKKPSPPANQP